MKNKRNVIIISGCFLILLLLLGFYFVVVRNKKNFDKESFRIVKKEEYIGYNYNLKGKSNYYINNGNHFIAFDKDNNKVLEFNIPQQEIIKNVGNAEDIIKYYVLNEEDEFKLFDLDGKVVKKSNQLIKVSNDSFNNKSYYIYEGNLYNENDEMIYKDLLKEVNASKNEENFNFNVYGSYVYCQKANESSLTKRLINLKTNDIISVDSFSNYDNYVEFFYNKNGKTAEIVYVLDLKNDELNKYSKYEEKSYGNIVYNNENDKKILTNSQILNYGEKIEYNGFKFDYTVCEDGFKVYSNDNKLIINECYNHFNIDYYNIIYLYKNNSVYYLKDNKIYNKIPVGKYLVNDNNIDVIIYDDKDNEISTACKSGFNYYKDGLYICNDGKNVSLLNEKLNKVSEEYEDIHCKDSYCYMIKNGKYGLLHNNKVIIEPVYEEIYFEDKAIIAEDDFKLDIFTLGDEEFLSENQLYEEFSNYKDINVDDIIVEYELNDIKDVIKDNSELFKKYAYVTINNNGLDGYKKNVLKAFVMVAKNKQYLDESYFINSLKKLNIRQNNIENEGIAGLYYPNVSIEVENNNQDVIYHELTHFIDNRLNRTNYLHLYRYKEKYINDNEYELLSEEEKKDADFIGLIDFNFVTEGGAEFYSGIYLRNNYVYAYPFQVTLFNMFSYLYGSDFMKEVFFASNGEIDLFNKLIQGGFSYEEITEFNQITNRTNENPNSEEKIYCLDMIISLYEKEKEGNWYEDEIFSYFVSQLMPYQLKPSYTKRYDEYKKLNNRVHNDIIKMIDNKYEIILDSANILYYDNSSYFNIRVKEMNDSKIRYGYLIVNYDVKNQEIKDYRFVEN